MVAPELQASLGVTQELYSLPRQERRERQDDLIPKLHPLLEKVHSHYLITYTNALAQYSNQSWDMQKLLSELKKESAENEAERTDLRIQISKLAARTWNPPNQKYIKSLEEYFLIKMPWLREAACNSNGNAFFSDKFLELLDHKDLPEDELKKRIAEALNWIKDYPRSTGYSTIIQTLESLNFKYAKDPRTDNILKELKAKAWRKGTPISEDDMTKYCSQIKQDNEKKSFIVGSLEYVLSELRKKWQNCVEAYSEVVVNREISEEKTRDLVHRTEPYSIKKKRLSLPWKLSIAALLIAGGLAAIFRLPTVLSWTWFLSHPRKLALESSGLLIWLGIIWALFDEDQNRRSLAIGSVVIATMVGIIQLL